MGSVEEAPIIAPDCLRYVAIASIVHEAAGHKARYLRPHKAEAKKM